MEQLFTYLWQSAVVLTMLYVPFQLLLRKEHYFALNRAILLAIMVLSLVLPLSHHTMPEFVQGWFLHDQESAAAATIELVQGEIDGEVIVLKNTALPEPSWLECHGLALLMLLWGLGTVTFLFGQGRGLYRLYKVLHDRDNIREALADGNTLLLTEASLPSFSWMHSIVLSVDDYSENGETILVHERAHIAHHHSLDRLLLLVVHTLQWWNPFVWLMADALTQVHEYQADLAVLNQGINATQYQLLLIRKAAGPAGLALVNGFKRNKLKLRIVMMNNMIKLRGAKSRYVVLLPMMLLAVAFTARAEVQTVANTTAVEESPIPQYQATFTTQDEDDVVNACDQEPEYPGGIPALTSFIGENLRYPKKCAEQGVEGRVILSFVIEKNGAISNVEEMRSPDSLLTTEAIRVVKAMPKWTPGMQDGKQVRVRYILPVTFRLNDDDNGKSSEKATQKTPSNPVASVPSATDLLFIYDGNVIEYEKIKDLPPSEIAVGSMLIVKDGDVYEQYLKKYPKAKNGVVILNSYSTKDQLWVVDGVPMTGDELEEKYPTGFEPKFQQLHKDAETLAKYSQYPQARKGVNVVRLK